MSNESFYSVLPVITDFEAITRAESYAALPDDWHIALCDVRKFSDIYRQILSGTAAQRLVLDAWLQQEFNSRRLLYGLHVTDRANQYISRTGV